MEEHSGGLLSSTTTQAVVSDELTPSDPRRLQAETVDDVTVSRCRTGIPYTLDSSQGAVLATTRKVRNRSAPMQVPTSVAQNGEAQDPEELPAESTRAHKTSATNQKVLA